MQFNGLVYVIESPSPSDLLDGRTEGNSLCSSLRLAGIKHWYSLVTNRATFHEALGDRLAEAYRALEAWPVIHLSMHGNEHGIGFTDGTLMSWDELRQAMQPLMEGMQGWLLVCMSTCNGFSGCRMAMNEASEHTFWKLVGSVDSVDWSVSAVAFVTFYHLLFRGKEVEECVALMNAASDSGGTFQCREGVRMKGFWLNFIKNREVAARGILGAAAESQATADDHFDIPNQDPVEARPA